MENVRLVDIADHVGVSVATVSRSMRNGQPGSSYIHNRIQRVANELGYKPMRNRVSLQGIGRVAMITAGITMDGGTNRPAYESYSSFYGRFIFGVEKAVGERGGYLTVLNGNRDENLSVKIKKAVNAIGVTGIVLLGQFQLNELELDDGVPVVMLNASPEQAETVDSVASDDIGAIARLVKYLRSLGHQRIAFLTDRGPSHHKVRLESYRRACTELGLEYQQVYYVGTDEENLQKNVEACFRQYMEVKDKPTAIICSADPHALMFLRLANEHVIRVPEALSVVGFDNIEAALHSVPALSSIELNLEEMGREAVHLLAHRMAHPEYVYRQVVIRSKLIERETISRIA